MLNLKELANILLKSSDGQLGDLEIPFYKSAESARFHLEHCKGFEPLSSAILKVKIKLSNLISGIEAEEICFSCWNTFESHDVVSLVNNRFEARVLNALIKASQAAEPFADASPSILDLEQEGRGGDLFWALIGINDAFRVAPDASAILSQGLDIMKSKLTLILDQLRTLNDSTESHLKSLLAWEVLSQEEDDISEVIISSFEDAGVSIEPRSEFNMCLNSLLDNVTRNQYYILGILQNVRRTLGYYLKEAEVEQMMTAFTPKLEQLHLKFVNVSGPNALASIDFRPDMDNYSRPLDRLLVRYAFQGEPKGIFMVVPAYAQVWLERYYGIHPYNLAPLDLGESSAILDTTIRLNVGDGDGLYSSLYAAYQAAVNLV